MKATSCQVPTNAKLPSAMGTVQRPATSSAAASLQHSALAAYARVSAIPSSALGPRQARQLTQCLACTLPLCSALLLVRL